MALYIALLRAVNVVGSGILPMAELREMAAGLGYRDVRTYIQSGNLIFRSQKSKARVKTELEAALAERLGKPCAVHLRTPEELRKIEAGNPFPGAEPAKVLVLFLESAPDAKLLAAVNSPAGERLTAGARELYVHFPEGQGKSRLKVPFADVGTGRNLNTLRALLKITFPS